MSEENKKVGPDSSAEKSKEKKNKRFDIKGTIATYKGEYRKIIWPTRKELIESTITVAVTCAAFAVIICGLDWIFKFGYDAFTKLF